MASDDFYYDLNGQQVQCSGGYYGLHRGYNSDGQNISLTFFDKDGHAVSTSSGYAIKTYAEQLPKGPLLCNEAFWMHKRGSGL